MKPWESEPDKLEFTAHGLDCYIRRNYAGALIAYARVPEGHPLHGKRYDDEIAEADIPKALLDRDTSTENIGDLSMLTNAGSASEGHFLLNVVLPSHGGVTFSGELRDREGWWFGFDCGQQGDLRPLDEGTPLGDGVYRTMDYVRERLEALACAIAEWPQGETS